MYALLLSPPQASISWMMIIGACTSNCPVLHLCSLITKSWVLCIHDGSDPVEINGALPGGISKAPFEFAVCFSGIRHARICCPVHEHVQQQHPARGSRRRQAWLCSAELTGKKRYPFSWSPFALKPFWVMCYRISGTIYVYEHLSYRAVSLDVDPNIHIQ